MPNPLADTNYWIVVLTTLVVVMFCVGFHYEVLSNCNRLLRHIGHRHRRRIFILILFILFAHVAEISLFTVGYYFLIDVRNLGELTGLELAGVTASSFGDYAYFSAVVYTTVGFGDLIPIGPVRTLASMEALTGLVMITWSASFTFLEMQRYWRPN